MTKSKTGLVMTLKTYGSIHVRWRIRIWFVEQANHADQNGFDTVHRQPTFAGLFVAKIIVTRLVQNRNANVAVLIDCGGRGDWED